MGSWSDLSNKRSTIQIRKLERKSAQVQRACYRQHHIGWDVSEMRKQPQNMWEIPRRRCLYSYSRNKCGLDYKQYLSTVILSCL